MNKNFIQIIQKVSLALCIFCVLSCEDEKDEYYFVSLRLEVFSLHLELIYDDLMFSYEDYLLLEDLAQSLGCELLMNFSAGEYSFNKSEGL